MEAAPRRVDHPDRLRVAWELVQLAATHDLSVEGRADTVISLELAGLITLWTQLHTFAAGAPKIMVWTAWGITIAAILGLAPFVAPSLLRPGERVDIEDVLSGAPEEDLAEAEFVLRIARAGERRTQLVTRGTALSFAAGMAALLLTALAYVVEKA